jgi:hypothetical protein
MTHTEASTAIAEIFGDEIVAWRVAIRRLGRPLLFPIESLEQRFDLTRSRNYRDRVHAAVTARAGGSLDPPCRSMR